MDTNLADFAAQMAPEQKAAYLVQALKARQAMQGQTQIQSANEQAHSMDPMAVAAQLSNNPALAAAARTAQANQQARYKPVQMGMQGFVMPESGDFVESPIYKEEKQAQRGLQTDLAQQRSDDKRYALQQSMQLREMLARMAEEGRMDRSESANALRQSMIELSKGRRDLQNERFENTKTQQQQKNVQQFGAALTKNGLPQVADAVSGINDMLDKYPAGQTPGLGYGQKTLATIPGISDLTVGEEGKLNRSRIQKLVNAMTLTEAGKAVTKNEEARQAIVNMSANNYNEKDFRNAWTKVILPAIENVRANAHRSFDPSVVEDYVSNAAEGFDPRKSFIPTPKTAKRVRYDAQGNVVNTP